VPDILKSILEEGPTGHCANSMKKKVLLEVCCSSSKRGWFCSEIHSKPQDCLPVLFKEINIFNPPTLSPLFDAQPRLALLVSWFADSPLVIISIEELYSKFAIRILPHSCDLATEWMHPINTEIWHSSWTEAEKWLKGYHFWLKETDEKLPAYSTEWAAFILCRNHQSYSPLLNKKSDFEMQTPPQKSKRPLVSTTPVSEFLESEVFEPGGACPTIVPLGAPVQIHNVRVSSI
jgi:hypothetical protein